MIRKSTFPDPTKLAEIVPIFNKDDNLAKENYRLMSTPTSLANVLERLTLQQLEPFSNSVFYSSLAAYLQASSCNDVVVQITEDLKMSLDDGHFPAVILMDLYKALTQFHIHS